MPLNQQWRFLLCSFTLHLRQLQACIQYMVPPACVLTAQEPKPALISIVESHLYFVCESWLRLRPASSMQLASILQNLSYN